MRSVHPRPLVSLVLPTCDRPNLFARALESALDQRYENLEVLVVNDGGVPVEAVIGELDRHGRVVQLRLPVRRGPAIARNHGLRLARGEYVGFLDDDDTLDPCHVATLVAALRSGEHRIAYAHARRRLEEARDGQLVLVREDVRWPTEAPPVTTEALLHQNPLPLQAALLHRSCLEECGGFDETLSVLEDWELWLRLSRYFAFLEVGETTSTTTAHPDGLLRARARDLHASARRVAALHADLWSGRPEALAAQARLLERLARIEATAAPTCSLLVPVRRESVGHLRGFFEQLRRSVRGVQVEIVAINRGLSPEAARELEALDTRVVTSTRSLGESLDQAVAAASGANVVAVRSDVILEDGWLQALLAERDGEAIVGGKTLDTSGRVAHAGLALRSAGDGLRPLFVGVEANATELFSHREVDAIASATVLVPRSVASSQGFGSIDDWSALADLCLRARAAGTPVRLAAASVAYRIPSRVEAPWLDPAATAALAPAAARLFDALGETAPSPTSVRSGASRRPLDVAGLLEGRSAAEAWELLVKLADARPDDGDVIQELSRVGLARGAWRELSTLLGRYVAMHPDDHEKRYALVSVSLRADDPQAARRHFEELVARAPTMVGLESLRRRLTRAA